LQEVALKRLDFACGAILDELPSALVF